MKTDATIDKPARTLGRPSLFGGWLALSTASYVLLIVALIVADVLFVLSQGTSFSEVLRQDYMLQSIKLTFLSCTMSAVLSVIIAVPIAYLLSRYQFRGRAVIDAILDVPVILPPLVIGLSLLILFNYQLFEGVPKLEAILNNLGIRLSLTQWAVVLAQFTVAAAFAVRTMKASFDQIDSRSEKVAMTMGCSRGQAFFYVVLPQAVNGVITAGTLAWARALGEFGPILVFAGATRGRTEVLSTSVYLEINTGNIGAAVVISLLMIVLAMTTILTVRLLGERGKV